MTSLRILHVMESLGEGGAEQNLLTIVRETKDVCRHELAWLYDDTRLEEAFRPHVDRMIALHCTKGFGMVAAAWRLAQAIRRDPPDLIHAKLIRAQLVARMAARLAGNIPLISTWECVSYNERMYIELGTRGKILKPVTQLLDAVTGLGDRHIVAVSKEVATYNARKLAVPMSRVSVVYNAVDRARILEMSAAERERKRAELHLPPSAPVLLSVGRLVDQKNYETTLRAMPAIVSAVPAALWIVAGAGPRQSELQSMADAEGVGASVRFLGARSDVPELLQVSDLFVFASHYEGLGIALMEALAAGLPAVASRIPTTLEVAEGLDTVRFFEATDADQLARDVVAALAELPALRARARIAAARVEQRFSPENMISSFMRVAREAANADRS